MSKPTLVIMAAGMGSRFGGAKQTAPIDDAGQIIIEYSIYDAIRAGFGRVICVIKPEMEPDFHHIFDDGAAKHIEIQYALQTLFSALPEGFAVPDGREKPWGTGHAVLCALPYIDGPFAVINADDFYGCRAFQTAGEFLRRDGSSSEHALVAYRIENTLSENGLVSRGICEADASEYLTDINERTQVDAAEGGAVYYDEEGQAVFIAAGTPVSMNLWAFRPGILPAIPELFQRFLTNDLPGNPLKAEFYIPNIPKALLREGRARVRLLETDERWYGLTYREDVAKVRGAMRAMKAEGLYPERLW